MGDFLKKIFGSEENAGELQKINEEFRSAIEDISRLEEDWKEKVRLVKEFVGRWDSSSWDLKE